MINVFKAQIHIYIINKETRIFILCQFYFKCDFSWESVIRTWRVNIYIFIFHRNSTIHGLPNTYNIKTKTFWHNQTRIEINCKIFIEINSVWLHCFNNISISFNGISNSCLIYWSNRNKIFVIFLFDKVNYFIRNFYFTKITEKISHI